MGRSPCCSKQGMNRGAWTAMEDKILVAYIKAHGEGQWRNLPKRAGLKRCGKSCRLRWLNYLRPDIKRGNISLEEEDLIIRLHNLLGNRWSLIAARLPGRTDNEIKNYWNTTLGRKATNAQNRNTISPSLTPAIENSGPGNLTFDPSNSPQPTQVIRTRATRCTRVIIPFENQTGITIFPTPAQLPQNSPNFLNNLESGEQDHHQLFQRREMESFAENQNQSSPSDQDAQAAMINDWITSVNSLENNDILDLDSLAYLLEPEEWP